MNTSSQTGVREGSRFLNRETSFLDFNRRVLALAEDESRPLLERTKFVAIVSGNLDHFFQVRVAGLKAQAEVGVESRSPDGKTPSEQIAEIRENTLELVARQSDVFQKSLRPMLAENDIALLDWADLGPDDQKRASRVFFDRLHPVLTPIAVDPAHPFPYISNLSLNLAIIVRDSEKQSLQFARVKVPSIIPRFLALNGGTRFVAVEQVIANHLDTLFRGMEVVGSFPFRLTRDADLAVEDAEDLRAAIESGLRRRLRLNAAVRLETTHDMSDGVRDLLFTELQLGTQDTYSVSAPLDLSCLWHFHSIDRPDLKERPIQVSVPSRLQGTGEKGHGQNLFETIRQQDLLVHHPYESFRSSVGAFLALAASDPKVLAIKHTLYRTSGTDRSIIRSLIRAAEAGKQVVALVELRARFDEEANLEWAKELEKAGAHVIDGVAGLKTHTKITLVVRQEGDAIERYCHVGTGNYNPETARSYEDVSMFTRSRKITSDLTELFNYLTGYAHEPAYQKLLVAPHNMRQGLLQLIQNEARKKNGHIVIKVNSLADPEIIEALYEASSLGVRVDLIVRSICCLVPGAAGLSENIHVRSIVGRFLEHSRIFRFGSEESGRSYFFGSADLMPRNLDVRVESLIPIKDPETRERLDEILELGLADDSLAWSLGPDGEWHAVPTNHHREVQQELEARNRKRNRPDH